MDRNSGGRGLCRALTVATVPAWPRVSSDDVEEGAVWFERMVAAGFHARHDNFFWLIRGYGERRDFHKAEEWFGKIEEAGLTLTGSCYKNLIWPMVVVTENNADFARATRWVEHAESKGLAPAELAKVYEAMLMGSGRRQCSRYDIAEKYHAKLTELGLESTEMVFKAMMVSAASAGKNEVAQGWYRSMLKSGISPNRWTLTALRSISW